MFSALVALCDYQSFFAGICAKSIILHWWRHTLKLVLITLFHVHILHSDVYCFHFWRINHFRHTRKVQIFHTGENKIVRIYNWDSSLGSKLVKCLKRKNTRKTHFVSLKCPFAWLMLYIFIRTIWGKFFKAALIIYTEKWNHKLKQHKVAK